VDARCRAGEQTHDTQWGRWERNRYVAEANASTA
jgi:hypothetical protein